MRRPTAALLTALVLALAALGLVGCGGGDEGTTQTAANEAICQNVADVQSAANAVTSLDPQNTTVNQLKSATSSLTSAVQGLTAATTDASSEARNELQGSVDDLKSAVKNIGSGESVSQGVESAQAAA